MQRSATAVLLTLAAACAERPTEPSDGRAATSVEGSASATRRGELSGWFHTVTGDPQEGRGRPIVVRTLVEENGEATELVVEPSLLRRHAGGMALHRKRVRVQGQIRADGRFEVTAIDPETGAAAAEEQPVLQAGAFPYITILCKFADAPTVEPRPVGTYKTWMTSTSAPYLDHYWREQSFNLINKSGSQVVGWFTLPHPRSHYLPNGSLDLEAAANDCTTAADASVYFPSFSGVHLQFNQRLDCCSWGGTTSLDNDGQIKQYGMTWLADWADLTVIAHEEGHGLGLPHSSGPTAQVNNSEWDVMSYPYVFYDPNFASYIPQHTISRHKDMLGWIPSSRKMALGRNTTRTLILERLAQPGSGNYLMATIPVDKALNPGTLYIVEARQFVGRYDSHVPGEAVVMYLVDPAMREATVVDVDNNGNPNDEGAMWRPGETFTDADNKVSVRVDARTTTGFQVTLTHGVGNTPNTWAVMAPMPTARRQLAAGVVGGMLYAIGGRNAAGTVLRTVQVYNPTTNAWTTRAALPSPRWRTNGAAAIKTQLYVAGGVQPGTVPFTKTLYAYNPGTNAWSVKAPMPVAGGCGGSGAIAGILYVLIGCDATTSSSAGAKGILLRYNPTSNTWARMANALSGHQFPGFTAIQGKLYVVGGINSSGIVSTALEVYDTATKSWSRKAPLPSARHSLTAAGIGGKLYAVGGTDAAGNFTNTVYVYDPVLNTWSVGSSPMPTRRAAMSAAANAGILYEVGGNNSSSSVLAANEAFTP